MISDSLPYRPPLVLACGLRACLAGGVLLVLLLSVGPSAAQDVIVDDDGTAALPANCGGSTPVASTVNNGISNADPGDVIFVCPGTYPGTVTVDKSVTLEGNNAGTPGNGSRAPETVVDAGTGSFTSAAFTIQADDVTIDGFRLTGSQGVELNGSNATNRNDWVGATVQNNLIETNIRGVRIRQLTTTASKSFTLQDNQFAIQQQLFDQNGSTTAGDATGEETSSIELRDIDGPTDGARPTIQENVVTTDGDDDSGGGTNDGSFYGYEIDGVNISSGPVSIVGNPTETFSTGIIQGTAQAVAVLDGQSDPPPQSNIVIEDFSISMMSGSAPDNSAVNFHAGLFTFVDESNNDGETAVAIRDVTIEGLDFSDTNDDFSANVNLSHFGGIGGTATQDIDIEGVTIQNTEQRGIALAGGRAQQINATITDDAGGDNTVVQGVAAGSDAHPIHSEEGGSLTINNTDITNEDVPDADALHIRDAGATVTIGSDVTIDPNGHTFLEDQPGRAAIADLNVTSTTTVATAEIDLHDTIDLLGSGTLRVTDRLTLTGGTFDVTNGNFTLASDGPASTAFISGNGTGTLTGEVTVEWKVPSGPDGWDGWQALTAPVDAPFDGGTSNALLSNMWTQKSGSGTGYDAANGGISNSSVFDYDETASVGGTTTEDLNDAWFAPSDISTAITQGKTGRLVFFFKDRDFDNTDEDGSPFTLSATGSVLAKENTDTDVDLGLTYTENDGGGDGDGWNLVGNPFMAPIDWEAMTNDGAGRTNVERTVYIPTNEDNYATYQADPSGTSGSHTNGGTRYLSPFQGFFVKATGSSPALTLKSDDKALGESPTLKRNEPPSPKVKLRMRAENSSRDEETVVRFSEEAALDAGDGDAYQLVPFGSDYFYIASEIDGTDRAYEIQSLPPPGGDGRTVPLNVTSASPGTYTIGGTLNNVSSDWDVQLKNQDTGETADLQAGETLSVALDGTSKSTSSTATARSAPSAPSHPQPLVAAASRQSPDSGAKAASDDTPRLVLRVTGNPLPVELTQFDGQATDNAVELQWTTASETNNTGFQVQRSSPTTEQWNDLGFVDGEGTSSSPHNYRFTDKELPYDGTELSYRLKQVDADGSVTYSDPITVERGAPSTVRIRSLFPNPARKQTTVHYTLPEATHVTMALYDVLGRKVATVVDEQKEAGRQHYTIPVTSLANGVHFLRIRANQTVQTKKLVVIE